MKYLNFIFNFLIMLSSYSSYSNSISFEENVIENCHQLFHDTNEFEVGTKKINFQKMSNIFIAKISNDFNVKDKKIMMNFEVLANLKGDVSSFKLETTFLYDNNKSNLNRCNLIGSVLYSSRPKIMLISFTEQSRKYLTKPSVENTLNLSKHLVGVFIKTSGSEIVTGIEDLNVSNSALEEDIKRVKRATNYLMTNDDDILTLFVQDYKKSTNESKYSGIESKNIKVDKNDVVEFKKYREKLLLDRISNVKKEFENKKKVYKTLQEYKSLLNPILRDSVSKKVISDEIIKLNQEFSKLHNKHDEIENIKKIEEIIPGYINMNQGIN